GGDLLATLDEGPVGNPPDGVLLLELNAEHAAGRGEVPLLPGALEAGAGSGAHDRRPDDTLVLHEVEHVVIERDDDIATVHVDRRIAVAGRTLAGDTVGKRQG